MYKTLEVLGPEHEFSIVDETLKPLPIVDRIIKELRGRIVNNVVFKDFSFGKELQSHVAELKAEVPFASPCVFEETMHKAVMEISELLERRFYASLLGLGMHPLLRLNETEIWSHRDRSIYEAMDRIFNLRQHGWLNIQSYQLNLPYSSEREGVKLHNTLATIIPYLPAISAASPVYESKISEYIDSRLYFYVVSQKEVPSVTGEMVPECVTSFKEYRKKTIEKYSSELRQLHAPQCLIGKEWLNSRGAIFRFDRRAIEIRIMDEQECVKSDVALSCFIRALIRGLLQAEQDHPHRLLVEDFNAVIKDGLEATVLHSSFSKARDVCLYLYGIALKNATEDEKKYLWLIKKRITDGSLSNLIIRDISKRSQKTSPVEAILDVYLTMIENLKNNEPYL